MSNVRIDFGNLSVSANAATFGAASCGSPGTVKVSPHRGTNGSATGNSDVVTKNSNRSSRSSASVANSASPRRLEHEDDDFEAENNGNHSGNGIAEENGSTEQVEDEMEVPDEISLEEIKNLLGMFTHHFFRSSQVRNRARGVMEMCRRLMCRDTPDLMVISNENSELSHTYPYELLIPQKSFHKLNERTLRTMMQQGRFARCRCRFPVPVILYNGRYVCRSATIAGSAEIYGRAGMDLLFSSNDVDAPPCGEHEKHAGKQCKDELSPAQCRKSKSADTSPVAAKSTWIAKTSLTPPPQTTSGPIVVCKDSQASGRRRLWSGEKHSCYTSTGIASLTALARKDSSQVVNSVRKQDINLLKQLGVKHIIDLMVEKKKVKFGVNITSSEKVDKENRYNDFNIFSLPYPGCEFFKDYRNNAYSGEGLIFDWSQHFIDAMLDIPTDPVNKMISVNWNDYKKWDVIRLTQNYLKLINVYLRESKHSLLVHCISGWDRTPLFISLVRLSLWADGVIHQSLSAQEIVYLTIAYDWFLFSHSLCDRLNKGEEIFFFCFYFLKYILADEYSVFHQELIEEDEPTETATDELHHDHHHHQRPVSLSLSDYDDLDDEMIAGIASKHTKNGSASNGQQINNGTSTMENSTTTVIANSATAITKGSDIAAELTANLNEFSLDDCLDEQFSAGSSLSLNSNASSCSVKSDNGDLSAPRCYPDVGGNANNGISGSSNFMRRHLEAEFSRSRHGSSASNRSKESRPGTPPTLTNSEEGCQFLGNVTGRQEPLVKHEPNARGTDTCNGDFELVNANIIRTTPMPIPNAMRRQPDVGRGSGSITSSLKRSDSWQLVTETGSIRDTGSIKGMFSSPESVSSAAALPPAPAPSRTATVNNGQIFCPSTPEVTMQSSSTSSQATVTSGSGTTSRKERLQAIRSVFYQCYASTIGYSGFRNGLEGNSRSSLASIFSQIDNYMFKGSLSRMSTGQFNA